MNKQLILILCTLLFVVSFASAEIQSLGYFQQNSCVEIIQTCGECTYVNLSSILYPNSSAAIGNVAMTKLGTKYTYEFCDTSTMGNYIVNGYGNPNGNGNKTVFSYDFVINGSGQEVSDNQVTMIIISLVMLLVVCIFFFILAMVFKHPGTKIFLMALSALTLIVIIGVLTGNTTTYLAEFPGIVNVYNQYYIFLTIMAGIVMFGIIGWLIYYSFNLFNKTRGRYVDDD
jgi:hypothetical protein